MSNYAWIVTLEPYSSAGVFTLTVSDAAIGFAAEQFEPGVERWGHLTLSRALATAPGWFNATSTLQILVRSYGEQDPDDNLVTLLQTRTFLEAPVRLELVKLAEAGQPRQLVFEGIVEAIVRLDRYAMTLRLRGQASTTHRPALTVTQGRYPDARQYDLQKRVPVLIGQVGWSAASVLREMIYTDIDAPGQPFLEESKDLAYLCATRGHAPARVVDINNTDEYRVRPASQDITGAELPNAFTAPPVVFLWPDEPRSPLWVLNAEMNGQEISIPHEAAADYPSSVSPHEPLGGPQDGQILVRRFHCPNEVLDESIYVPPVPGPVNLGWVNAQNALDRTNLASYAYTNGDVDSNETWFRCAHRFMRYPSRPLLTLRYQDGGRPRLVALVWAKQSNAGWTNAIWELEMKVYGQTHVTVTRDLTNLPAGWALIWWDILDTWTQFPGVDDFIAFNGTLAANRKWYGENGVDPADSQLERIGIRCVDGERHNTPPRLALFGLTYDHLVDPGPLTGLTKGSYLRGLEMRGDQGRPASVMTAFDAQGVNVYTPGAALVRWLQAATVEAKNPITLGDINDAPAGTFGSFTELDARLTTNVTGLTGISDWIVSAVEEADLMVEEILGKMALAVFGHFWYSTRTGLYNAAIFETEVAPHVAEPLMLDDLNDDEIVVQGLDLSNVYTAIYVEHWNRSRTVHIDNSTVYFSRDWKGERFPSLELEADTQQALFGRRELRVSLDYVRDPVAAWEVLFRMWRVLSIPRTTVRFGVSPAWGLEREPMQVFATNESLDRIMPVPAQGWQSWDGIRWRVNSVEVDPRGQCWVTATFNDSPGTVIVPPT